MNDLIHRYRNFFIPYFVLIVVVTFKLLVYEKIELHLLYDQYHNGFFDLFFKYVTHLGDGLLPVIVTIILLFVRFRYALMFGVGNFAAGLIAQLLKRAVFADMARPIKVIGAENLNLIEGVELATKFSFPSGHTTTVFCMATLLLLMTKNKVLHFAYFLVAALVGFSRIYLHQHFTIDAFVGSWIGVLTAVVAYEIFSSSRFKGLDGKINV